MARGTKKAGTRNNLAKHNLEQIIDNLPDPIFVTDQHGNVLLSNSTTAVTLDMTLDQLLKSNLRDLVNKGFYSKSYALEAAEKKCVVSGWLTTKLNYKQFSTSTPILDGDGNVQLILTTGKSADVIEKFVTKEDRENHTRRRREIEYLRSRVLESDTIVAESRAMRRVLLNAHAVAKADSTVVLYGESGTGKELLAKYLHRHSKRASEAFIAINCATLPEHLVESELFGYEKGAFTGANIEGKMGLFEAAHRGTLFLDEIAELPLALQSKLLRVLETYEVRRLGSNVDRKMDFRLIAATHKDLKKMTEEGTFRSDLYYRLNVIPIQIPPLRERPEDVIVLTQRFLEFFNRKYGTEVEFDTETLSNMQKHTWPGNVRELRNYVERIVINSLQDYCDEGLESILPVVPATDDCTKLFNAGGTLRDILKKVEEQYILHMLQACGGKMGETANRLGIYRTVLYRKLKALEKEKE